MAFHFPVMPRLFMAVQMEDRFPVVDILQQTPAIPETCQWAVFLRNHDELTLEMVTDEDRDYMYRVYASDPQARINLGIRRRLAPLMGNDRRRIELMNALLFSLPGTPVVYYGDEIGMGDNIYLGDRNGVRTPMQWSPDRNAGFSQANPQKLYSPVIIDPEYHYEALNVDAQQNNPHSLLWWMKHIIGLRRQYRAFGRGTLRFLLPGQRPGAHVRPRSTRTSGSWWSPTSRAIAQAVELDLADMQGVTPIEMFGRTPFPQIGATPYLVTLSPYAFYWFLLPAVAAGSRRETREFKVPAVSFTGNWEELVRGDEREVLEAVLPTYLRGQPMVPRQGPADHLGRRGAGDPDAGGDPGRAGDAGGGALPRRRCRASTCCRSRSPRATARARSRSRRPTAIVLLARGRRACSTTPWPTRSSSIPWWTAWAGSGTGARGPRRAGRDPHPCLRRAARRRSQALRASVLRGEQTNTSVNLGDRLLFKLFRKAEPGLNPDLELGRYLTDRTDFRRVPMLAGGLELRTRNARADHPRGAAPVRAQRGRRLDLHAQRPEPLLRAGAGVAHPADRGGARPPVSILDLARLEPPAVLEEAAGGYMAQARLLGRRTAEFHLALAADRENPAFAPEAFTGLYRRSIYQSLRSNARTTFDLLRRRIPTCRSRCGRRRAACSRWRTRCSSRPGP